MQYEKDIPLKMSKNGLSNGDLGLLQRLLFALGYDVEMFYAFRVVVSGRVRNTARPSG